MLTEPVLYLVCALLFYQCVQIESLCRHLKRCCPGRDSSCVASLSQDENYIFSPLNHKTCYCDHACLRVGDCCPDFKEICLVVDCEVSSWGHWSECSSDCGIGIMARTREVLQESKNGGQPCPVLQQSRACTGNKCEKRSAGKVFKETALILPAKYSEVRSMNESHDIRSNLRLRYPLDPMKENSKEYCILFEISKMRKTCFSNDDTLSHLKKGSRVCVSCEQAAMRKHLGYRCNGDGADGKTSRWISMAQPQCNGRWIRQGISNTCNCHSDGRPDFILV